MGMGMGDGRDSEGVMCHVMCVHSSQLSRCVGGPTMENQR